MTSSELMFRELFDTAPDAMIVVDRKGTIVRVNSQASRLFGFEENELRGQPVEILMPEQARIAHRNHLDGYTENPRVRPMGAGQELVGLKRDGQSFPVEIALSPINTPDGSMFVASIRDISETQRARQALLRARYDTCVAQIGQMALAARNFDSVASDTPSLVAAALQVPIVAIVFKHAQLKKMRVRAAHGIQTDVLDSLPWPKILSDLMTPDAVSNAGANLEASKTLLNELRNLGVNYDSSVIVSMSDESEHIGALFALSNERRSFDRDAVHFLQSVANLLAAAMQRTRSEEQLSHAQRLEAIGQLTGGIAHDFNNLLTVVSGNLQLLEDELGDRPEALEIIGNALRAVGRGAELTRKLLAFARRQHLAPKACNPQKLLGELGNMLRRTLGESITLSINCPTDIPSVFVDPGQLDAALVNLALNARDAMPRGGRLNIMAHHEHITVSEASGELKPGNYVVFTVTDTGHGMSPDVLARAFEPFFTTKDQGKGSGLGLSMVYGFVNQSGGRLTAESQLGYGTRVQLYLPVAATTEAENSKGLYSASRGNETILIVEDEPDVRGIALAFLRSLGYTVVTAGDAQEALKHLQLNSSIGLVFSDVVLGTGMTGFELAQEARRLRPNLPVLLTSGYEHSALNADEALSRYELLRKPYRREELAQAVRRTLDHSSI